MMRSAWKAALCIATTAAVCVLGSGGVASADTGSGKYAQYCAQWGTTSPTAPAQPEVCFNDLPSLLNYISGGKVSVASARNQVRASSDEFALINRTASAAGAYTVAYLYPALNYGGTVRSQIASGDCTATTSWYFATFGSFNNQLSSLKPGSACTKNTLWFGQSYTGPSQTFNGNTSYVGDDMNDQAESMRAFK